METFSGNNPKPVAVSLAVWLFPMFPNYFIYKKNIKIKREIATYTRIHARESFYPFGNNNGKQGVQNERKNDRK